MTPFDREVRAAVYRQFVAGVRKVTPETLQTEVEASAGEISRALGRLADQHRLALTDEGWVAMAHPFSGVPTPYRSVIGDRWWQANCAWDSLAILALLGDGDAHGPDGLAWQVAEGQVRPHGLVHLLVPAIAFWDDVVFT